MRAAGYVRVSTDEQAREGFSLDAQRTQIAEHARRHGWDLVEVYADEGWSGLRSDRPAYRRMLDDAAAGRFHVLLVWRFDRLGRDSVERLTAEASLDRVGVRILSLTEPEIQEDDASAPLLRAIRAGTAEMESRVIGQRVRAAVQRKAEHGLTHGGPAPYGYRYANGILVVVPEEAPIVRRIFAEFCEGRSQKAIARGLTKDRVPTPRRTASSGRKSSGKWTQPVIARMLRNPVYIGKVRLKGEVYDGQHEAIIDAETWAKAQRLREATARTKGGGRARPSAGTHLFIRGMLRCGQCGSSMIPRTIRARSKGGAPYEVYMCSGHVADVNACPQGPIDRGTIDTAVLTYLEEAGVDAEGMRASVAAEVERSRAEVRALREQAEREERQASERLARVRRDYQDGKINADEWREHREELAPELAAARAGLERLRKREEELSGDPLAHIEEHAIEQLVAIRRTLAGAVRDAKTLDAVRAALLDLYDHFVLRWELFDFEDGVCLPSIEPVPRDNVLLALQRDAADLAERDKATDARTT